LDKQARSNFKIVGLIVLKIFPVLDFSAQCPLDGQALNLENFLIPGMRCLAEGNCPTCNRHYFIDLPIAHALGTPMILDRDSGHVYGTDKSPWFKNQLRQSFAQPVHQEMIPIVHHFFAAEQVIIINCLDYLYGHALLKLLNVQRHLQENPELGCCVIVPSPLLHLVPAGVAEIWEVPITIKESWNWFPTLATWIQHKCQSYQACFLSPAYAHPSHRVYDLSKYVRNLPDISAQITEFQPIILFSYRQDRPWGRSQRGQQRHLQALYQRLNRQFPQMAFVLVGFGTSHGIRTSRANVIDLRVDQLTPDQDRLWLAYMSKADCAIGVHGSNMLLPSGLAKSTVELLPRSRQGNFFQDILIPADLSDPREIGYRYRFLYGNNQLSDVKVAAVVDLVAATLAFNQLCCAWLKVGEAIAPAEYLRCRAELLSQPIPQLALEHFYPPWLIRLKQNAKAIYRHLREGKKIFTLKK
jgi:hypothetical protein